MLTWIAAGGALALQAGRPAGAQQPVTPEPPDAIASVDAMGEASLALTHGDARALALKLEVLFGVGAAAAPWRDGLRTMADIPAISFDAVDPDKLQIRAPGGDLATVVAVARAVDAARGDATALVRIFGFGQASSAERAAQAMARLEAGKLLPGGGVAHFEASGRLLVTMAPGAAHPLLERVARDHGGTVVSLAQRTDEQIRLALERETDRQRRPAQLEAKVPGIEVVAMAPPSATIAVRAPVTPGPGHASGEVEPGTSLSQAAPPAMASIAVQLGESPAPGLDHVPAQIVDAGHLPIIAPRVALPATAIEQVRAASESGAAPQVASAPAGEPPVPAPSAPVAPVVRDNDDLSRRVARVVVLQAADALIVGPRVQQVAEAIFDDVSVMSAGAGNAMLVAGLEAEVDACVALLEDIDAAAARMTEDAMLVMLDGEGANDIASAVRQLVGRPGGELGVRVASDDARGAIALTGPSDAAALVGGLAEAMGRVDLLPPATAQAPVQAPSQAIMPQDVTSARRAAAGERAGAQVPRTGRDVVVRAIRPEGELRQTAEFVRELLERAGVSPVRVSDLIPGRSGAAESGDTQLARRRKLLVPKRIRMIINYSQTTLARLFNERGDATAPFDQVFAMPQRDAQTDPRLEVIVLPDRQALALVGDAEAVAKGAEIAEALGGAWGQDRIEVVPLQHAKAASVARTIKDLLAQGPGAGGQLQVSDEPRLNMVVLSGPAGTVRRGAALAREMDRGGPKTEDSARAIELSPRERLTPRVEDPRAEEPRLEVPASAPPTHAAPVVAVSALGYVIRAAASQTFDGIAATCIAHDGLLALVEGLVAQGQASSLGRYTLHASQPLHAHDGLDGLATGLWVSTSPLPEGALRVVLVSEPRNGDQTTVDVPRGELLVLTGAVGMVNGQATIDLARRPAAEGDLGLIILQSH